MILEAPLAILRDVPLVAPLAPPLMAFEYGAPTEQFTVMVPVAS